MQPQPFETLAIALDCLKAHPTWCLFPISRLEKFPPCFNNNLKLASNDPAQIKQWAAMYPGCNWGIALAKSKLVVPDVDTKPGKRGQQTLDKLELEHGPMPDTLTIRTPSGGLHYYYEEANGVTHQMRVSAFGPDVDSTNYVLVPGCWLVTSATQNYEIINDAPVAPTPAWFAEYLAPKVVTATDQTPAVDLDTQDIINRAIFYLRNDAKPSIQFKNGEFTLLITAAVLKDMGISQEMAIDLLAKYYNVPGKCEPLWAINDGPPADRLDIKVANAWNYLKNTQPGALSPQAEFGSPNATIDENDIEQMIGVWIKNPGLPKKSRVNDTAIAKAVREEMVEALTEPTPPETLPEPWDTGGYDDVEAVGDEPNIALDIDMMEPNAFPLNPASYSMIDESKLPIGIKDVCQRWVWIVGIKRFVNRVDPTLQWDTKQFDSQFNQFAEKSSVSNDLFKNGQLLRRFRYLGFRPGGAESRGVEYNVWRPSPIKPAAGDTALWNEHMNFLFQDENDNKMVLDWMAFVLQNPTLKPNHALLIVGRNTGTGKSFVARIMEQLIGVRHTSRPKNSSMGGDFNGWLMNCRLCILEEVYQVGRRENVNAMRDLITEARVEVNIKGIPAFPLDNYVSLMGISNHPDALPLDEFDRRWLVIETQADRKDRSEDYYKRLFALLNDKAALSAIYAELLARDLKGYNGLFAAPRTAARDRMIDLSRADEETWLLENAGNTPFTRNVIRAEDVMDAMPASMQRTKRLLTTIIPTFLRDRMRGVRHPEQVRLSSGEKIRVWVLHGRYNMVKDTDLAAIYERERKMTNKEAETTAKDDFGEA